MTKHAARNEDETPTGAVSEQVAEAVDIDVSATLKKAGIHYIWGEIHPGGLKDIHQDVLLKHYLGPKKFNSPIQLVINSGGGDVDETNSLIDLLANVRFPVSTAGFGTCASAGAWLLACGTRGLRTIARNAMVMVHSYSWSAEGKHAELVAHRHAQDAEYEKEIEFWMKHSKYTTRKDVEKYLLHKEDVWLTPKEAIKHGIVDQIGSVYEVKGK